MALHDHDLLMTAAGMRGRGVPWTKIARALNRNERTCRRWAELDVFKAEVERVRSNLAPTPKGVYLMALVATKPDGSPDWQARLRAADALTELEAVPTAEDDAAELLDAEGWT